MTGAPSRALVGLMTFCLGTSCAVNPICTPHQTYPELHSFVVLTRPIDDSGPLDIRIEFPSRVVDLSAEPTATRHGDCSEIPGQQPLDGTHLAPHLVQVPSPDIDNACDLRVYVGPNEVELEHDQFAYTATFRVFDGASEIAAQRRHFKWCFPHCGPAKLLEPVGGKVLTL